MVNISLAISNYLHYPSVIITVAAVANNKKLTLILDLDNKWYQSCSFIDRHNTILCVFEASQSVSKSLVAVEKSVQETRKQKNKGEKVFLILSFSPLVLKMI